MKINNFRAKNWQGLVLMIYHTNIIIYRNRAFVHYNLIASIRVGSECSFLTFPDCMHYLVALTVLQRKAILIPRCDRNPDILTGITLFIISRCCSVSFNSRYSTFLHSLKTLWSLYEDFFGLFLNRLYEHPSLKRGQKAGASGSLIEDYVCNCLLLYIFFSSIYVLNWAIWIEIFHSQLKAHYLSPLLWCYSLQNQI